MKKLLTLICLLASLTVFGQGSRCIVRNTTPCTVFYTLVMSVPATTPTCAIGGTSSVLSIPPGGSVTWAAPAVPGLPPASRYFIAAKVLDGPPTCTGFSVTVGEPVCGFVVGAPPFPVRTTSCAPCATVTATWTPSTPPGATSVLNIN